jgi:Methyltransferase FkbM domain
MLISLLDRFFSLFPETLKNKIRYSRFNFLWVLYFNLREKYFGGPFFGQLEEDKFILQYFPEKLGSYIDIGAGHPIRGSNSYYFYRNGWNGITVDPIEKNILLHKILRRRDSQLQSLIGNSSKEVFFYHFEPYEYSTTDDVIAKQLLLKSGVVLLSKTKMQVTALSALGLICRPSDPSFLSIDVEGKDYEVLKSNDWNTLIPRVICIESWSDNNSQTQEINEFLEERGYQFKGSVGLSHIYVHNEYISNLSAY